MAGPASLRDALRIDLGLRIFRRANSVHAVTTHARGCSIVVLVQQTMTMRALFEFRQLVGREGRVEFMHYRGIGMAARTKLNHPRAILIAIFLRPFLHVSVTKIGGGIAPVTTGARDASPKVNILDDFLQVHVRGDAVLRAE